MFADDFPYTAHNQSMNADPICQRCPRSVPAREVSGMSPVQSVRDVPGPYPRRTPHPPCGNPPVFCMVFVARRLLSTSSLFFLLIIQSTLTPKNGLFSAPKGRFWRQKGRFFPHFACIVSSLLTNAESRSPPLGAPGASPLGAWDTSLNCERRASGCPTAGAGDTC